jgi:hypothetical protein
MNIDDTIASQEVDIIKEDIDTILSDENWVYQVELRMNSHDRPRLDWGAELGVVTEDRWGMIIISRNAVGFEGAGGNSFINGLSYTMDTTDDFHIYRVEKVFDTVNLFIDSFDNPVLSVIYGDLYPSDFPHIRLAASSGPGISNFDVRSFLFCSNFAPIIDSILEFFDGSVADGSLEGSGPGNSADGRLNALRDMLEMAGNLINICDIEGACEQLMAAYKKCDGYDPEFVEGEAVSELSNMILDLMDELGRQ